MAGVKICVIISGSFQAFFFRGTTITAWWLRVSVRCTITRQRKSCVGARNKTGTAGMEERFTEATTQVSRCKSSRCIIYSWSCCLLTFKGCMWVQSRGLSWIGAGNAVKTLYLVHFLFGSLPLFSWLVSPFLKRKWTIWGNKLWYV